MASINKFKNNIALFVLTAIVALFGLTALVPASAGATAAGSPEPTYRKDDCNDTNDDGDLDSSECGILQYITIFIQVLSGLAGVVIAASIIYGGIQYSSSGGDPQKVSAAKTRIRNAIIALVFFIFGLGLLNWLVPGGVL